MAGSRFDNIKQWWFNIRLSVANVLRSLISAPAGMLVREGDDEQPSLWRIEDGVSYQLPIALPRRIAAQGSEVVQQHVRMTEAYRRYKHQFGDPFKTGEPFQMLPVTDPLTEMTMQERIDVLEQCHLAWERNPDANAAVTFNRLFSVGGGMQRAYRNKQVQEAIEAFVNNPENAFTEMEKTTMDTLQVDGELFLRFHGEGDADDIIMTAMPPWGVKAIKHQPGFMRRVIHYEYQITEDDGTGAEVSTENDNIPASDVIHVAINRKPYEQRGRPELYRVLPWLRAHKEWLEQRARQNFYKGSIVYDVTLKNASAGQVAAKRAQYKEPPKGATIAIHNDNEEWKEHSPSIGADDAKEDGRQIRLKTTAGMRLPEYFLSDGSMANLATASAQSLPALKSFAEWQDIARDRIWKPVFLEVLRRAGFDLDAEVPVHDSETGEVLPDAGKVKVRDAFDIKYQTLEDSDPKTLMDALTLAINEGLMSRETAAGHTPFDIDFSKEQRKIAVERQKEIEDMVQGRLPFPPIMPNGGQQNGSEEGREEGDNPEEVPAVRGEPVPEA